MSDQPPPVAPRGKGWLGLVGVGAFGIALIFTPHQEGKTNHAIPDVATHGAPWTICSGHTKDVHKGDTATDAQCKAYLAEDMRVAAATVARCIPVPLNVNQAAALYDATFNEGPAIVCNSSIERAAAAHNWPGMCANLARYFYGVGKPMSGLVNRRVDDIELCMWPTSNPQLVYPAHWSAKP
jgi:lysozyme